MKTKIVITFITVALLGLAATANAGDRYRGHRDAGHYRGHPGSHVRHVRSHYYRDRVRHHVGYYGSRHYGHYYGPRYGHGYYYGHHDHDRAWKVAAGAVILGSIIHAANHDRGPRTVVVSRSPARGRLETAASETWYQRDSSGDCFEVQLDRDGNEVWTFVDRSYCE